MGSLKGVLLSRNSKGIKARQAFGSFFSRFFGFSGFRVSRFSHRLDTPPPFSPSVSRSFIRSGLLSLNQSACRLGRGTFTSTFTWEGWCSWLGWYASWTSGRVGGRRMMVMKKTTTTMMGQAGRGEEERWLVSWSFRVSLTHTLSLPPGSVGRSVGRARLGHLRHFHHLMGVLFLWLGWYGWTGEPLPPSSGVSGKGWGGMMGDMGTRMDGRTDGWGGWLNGSVHSGVDGIFLFTLFFLSLVHCVSFLFLLSTLRAVLGLHMQPDWPTAPFPCFFFLLPSPLAHRRSSIIALPCTWFDCRRGVDAVCAFWIGVVECFSPACMHAWCAFRIDSQCFWALVVVILGVCFAPFPLLTVGMCF